MKLTVRKYTVKILLDWIGLGDGTYYKLRWGVGSIKMAFIEQINLFKKWFCVCLFLKVVFIFSQEWNLFNLMHDTKS